MVGGAGQSLTDKQMAVLERIDRRMPIKVIACEMGVSETRINQHIRALKKIFGVTSLNELVECYRRNFAGDQSADLPQIAEVTPKTPISDPFRNSAYSKKQLQELALAGHSSERDDPGSIRMSDAHVVARDALWAHEIEPVVVFGALDGKHAVLYRFAAMIGLAFGMIAALVLVVSAALALSQVLDGRIDVPVDENGVAG